MRMSQPKTFAQPCVYIYIYVADLTNCNRDIFFLVSQIFFRPSLPLAHSLSLTHKGNTTPLLLLRLYRETDPVKPDDEGQGSPLL